MTVLRDVLIKGSRFRLAAAVVLLGSASIAPGTAADTPSCLKATVTGDGDTVNLSAPAEGTTAVRLAGIVSPLPPADAFSAAAWPPVAATRDGLAAMLDGHCLRLVPDAPMVDRYNRLYAQLYRDDGLWIQAELVRRGLVLVLPGLDAADNIRRLLPLEAEARDARRGLWADEHYAVRAADAAGRYVGTLQLVEGRVVGATRVGPRVYLNFGDDWRTDFTVVIPAKQLRDFARAGMDPLQLGGRRIRVRGVVETLNGPMIEALHPEVIEVVE